jgi:hypothetical protein
MATQLMALPLHHQQQQHHHTQPHQAQAAHAQPPAVPQELQQQYRGPRQSGEYRQPRPPRPTMTNGYSMHRPPNGHNAQLPSQYSQQSQVLNGSQTHSTRFQSPRGPRPHGGNPRPQHPHHQHTGPRNGNNVNGNPGTRLPFTQRNSTAFTPPTVYASQVYHQSPPPPGVGGPQIPYHQADRQYYPRPQQTQAPFPVGNVYQF